MKKVYIAPTQTIVIVNIESHLLQDSYGINGDPADGDGFVKENRYRRNRWGDYDWDE